MRKILQFFNRTYIFYKTDKKRFIFWMFFLSGIAYSQMIFQDSNFIVVDTIDIEENKSTVIITVKNDAKIYITEGTVTSNFNEETLPSEHIVYLQTNSITETSIEHPFPEENRIVTEKTTPKTISEQITKIPEPQESEKFQSIPYRNPFGIYKNPFPVVCIINYISNNTQADQVTLNLNFPKAYEYIYKSIEYSYIFNTYSKYISTIEIRSPALFI